MSKVGSKKNHGWGRKLTYAAHNALRENCKSINTVKSHKQRWTYAAKFFKENGINDVSKMKKEHLTQFAQHVQEKVTRGEMSKSYAKNVLSSTNKVLETLRGDRDMRVRPAAYVGERSQVRSHPVQTRRAAITRAARRLDQRGHERAAQTIRAARDLGLRLREAAQLDYRRAYDEARRHGKVNVIEGTKGNRGQHIDRWVPVSKDATETLRAGAQMQGDNKNIMRQDETYRQFVNTMREARQELKTEANARIHDLRAAYAVERYEQLTGYRAPVHRARGEAAPSAEADRDARATISYELGHNREDVTNAYIGGKS